MRTGRWAEVRDGILRWRALAPAAVALAVGVAILSGAAFYRARAEARFDRLRSDHRRLSQAVLLARGERAKEASIRRALEELSGRAAAEGNLRPVFDPLVSPGKGSGVETKAVSYQVHEGGGKFKVYEIRFSAAGRYPDIGRFLARLEGGRPGFVVDGASLKPAKEGVAAEITLRVLVR